MPGADANEKKRIRNEEIERRLAVIDANFKNFEIALAKENVQVDFLVAVVQVGVGGAGALVAETASQMLSAATAGLAGAQEAYSKAALFEKALSALLQQMIASRKAILVQIYQGRTQSIDEYPLSAAVQDLDAYYFAGSLPGAIVATSADATVKNNEAQDKLAKLRVTVFSEDASKLKSICPLRASILPPGNSTATLRPSEVIFSSQRGRSMPDSFSVRDASDLLMRSLGMRFSRSF